MTPLKRGMSLALTLLLALGAIGCWGPAALAAGSVVRADKTVALPGGGSRSVTALEIDLSDPAIRVLTVHAAGGVGATASLKDIANQLNGADYEVLAAINGTFFDAYVQGRQVALGAVVENGQLVHKYDMTAIGFGLDNTVAIERIKIRCIGWVGGVKNNLHSFYIHNWNRLLPAPSDFREAILTPAFGARTGDTDMNVVVVQNDVITAITKGDTAIPRDGFVYLFPQSSAYNDGRFKVGACFEYRQEYQSWDGSQANSIGGVDWTAMHSITGVGPSLVRGGSKTANASNEGWSDAKLTTGAGTRSFIGYDESRKKLVMGTVQNCTISQAGDLAMAYGLYDALNLDGGASSGLLLEGSYLTTPGRELSNAIVVVRVKQSPMSPWARAVIARGISLRYIPGDLQSGYTGTVTRAEYCRTLIQMLQRATLMGKNELMTHFGVSAQADKFHDVIAYQDAILAANALGIVSGTGDTTFNPYGGITRAEAAVMLANVIRRFEIDIPDADVRFTDKSAIPQWALDSVITAAALGLMQGDADGRFDPGGTLTREQCFAVVLRLSGFIPELSAR